VEMARGALQVSSADTAVATTGVSGEQAMDGVLPGTVWFAWAYKVGNDVHVATHKERFFGDRQEVQLNSARFALEGVMRHLPK